MLNLLTKFDSPALAGSIKSTCCFTKMFLLLIIRTESTKRWEPGIQDPKVGFALK